MTMQTPLPGRAKAVKAKLTTTDLTTIFTQSTRVSVVVSVSAANITGTAATFSLAISDGVTDWYIAKDWIVQPNQTDGFGCHEIPLAEGDSVKVQTDTANAIDVVMVVVEGQPNA